MRCVKFLGAIVLLAAFWSCSGPDQRVPHVDPLERVPQKAEPLPGGQSSLPAPAALETGAAAAPPGSPSPAVPPPPPSSSAAAPAADPLRALADRVILAVAAAQPSHLVAVFPALSPSSATGGVRASVLGDRISNAIADGIRRRLPEVEVPTFGNLQTLILQVGNRGLGDILAPEDPFFLADRIGAEIVVMGKIRPTVDDRSLRLLRLQVEYEARDLRTGASIAVAMHAYPGDDPAAAALNSELELAGEWVVGAYAPPFTPSLERELEFVIYRMVRRLLAAAGPALAGKRLAVAPVRTESFSDLALDDFIRAFNEERRSLAQRANGWKGVDVNEQALDMGPVTLMGKSFASLRAARDHLRVLMRATRVSVSAQFSNELTNRVAEELRRQGGAAFEVSLSMDDRREIENFIAREGRVVEETGTIDPATIAQLRTKGGEILLAGRFACMDYCYELSGYLLDMTTGQRVGAPAGGAFDARLTEEIKKRF